MIYITGDTHRDFTRISEHCAKHNTTKEDLMIILGDSGINYYGSKGGGYYDDNSVKQMLADLPITFMLVRGNHEMRPSNIPSYREELILAKEYAGFFMVEEEYPSLLFAVDGERYGLLGKWAAVYGGAYSVDKPWRTRGTWWPDEQLSEQELSRFYTSLAWDYDSIENEKPEIILTHTCPKKYTPTETFLPGIDQSTVDDTMERWFDSYEALMPPDVKWYCGHWHIDKTIDRMRFMFKDIITL